MKKTIKMMRNAGRLGAAAVLTLVLALPASAGYISTGVVNPPPPPPAPTATAGEMGGGETPAEGGETGAPFAGVLRTLLESMLSLL